MGRHVFISYRDAQAWPVRSQAVDWASAATLVAGCCRVMPADIAALAQQIRGNDVK